MPISHDGVTWCSICAAEIHLADAHDAGPELVSVCGDCCVVCAADATVRGVEAYLRRFGDPGGDPHVAVWHEPSWVILSDPPDLTYSSDGWAVARPDEQRIRMQHAYEALPLPTRVVVRVMETWFRLGHWWHR